MLSNDAQSPQAKRIFKTKWFSKAAGKARIGDSELCEAIQQVMLGQADGLGGGVFKKRLNENRHRAVILAKGGQFWVYVYVFAKQDRDNIGDAELAAFRNLADIYAKKTEADIRAELRCGELVEICHAGKP